MKLYVGNLDEEGTVKSDDLRPLFERYGTVTECECIKNYAFVHMEDNEKANEAVRNLNGTTVNGRTIKVEKSESRGPRKPSQKLFVGNLAEGTTSEQLREIFERHAPVMEADVIKNFGFVHIDADAGKGKVNEILRALNGYDLNGSQIRVQQSTSGVRQKPGMGGDQCYRCGRDGHWSKECPQYPDYDGRSGNRGGGGGRGGPMRGGPPYGGRNQMGGQGMGGGHPYRGDPYPPPPPPSYMREQRSYGDSGYGGADYGGARSMVSQMSRDPYGRPTQPIYDDRRGAYPPPMAGGRDMQAGPMRGPDLYGRYDSGQDMGYSSGPMGNPSGYNDAPPPHSGYGYGASSAPAYSTQAPAYVTGGSGGDMYSRRSPGPPPGRAPQSGYGMAPRAGQGMAGGQGGYGQPPQGQPAGGYGGGGRYGY